MIQKSPTAFNERRLQLDDSARMHSRSRNPVLVAIDGTSIAEGSLPLALAIAKRWNAPLRLVHVRNPGEDVYDMDICLIDNGESLSVRSRAGAYLESLAESLSKSNDLPVDSITISGVEIEDTLRAICKGNASRLLVMARTRRSNVSRFLSGSVTNRLIGSLAAPLLLVPAESRAANPDVARCGGLNSMLLHLDGNDASDRVLDHAISIASEDTVCHLRRVVPLASLNSTRQQEFAHGSNIRAEAWRELFQARDKLERSGIKCTTRLIFDGQNVGRTIVAQAKAMQVQVIVVATRKRLLPWWLRSGVAEYVVGQAQVPVMIVPRYGNVVPPAKANRVDICSN